MANTIMRRISDAYDDFTPSLKKIADYLLSHQVESQYLSISELAADCEVGKATISRFCKALGFDGYNYLKLALARACAADAPNASIATGAPDPDATVESMAKGLLRTNVTALEETVRLLDWQAVLRSVSLLNEAEGVWCMGQGGSDVLAQEAWARFATISPRFHSVTDVHLQVMTASLLGKSSVILYVSYSGATRDAIDILGPARERGCKVILITHHKSSPTAELADEVLLCGGHEGPLEVGSVSAKVATLFVLDVLFNEFWRQNAAEALRNRDVTTEALSSRML